MIQGRHRQDAVVGAVAGLHDRLAWFERSPLYGKRVLVTRSAGQASRLSMLLYQAGATPVEVPALEVRAVKGAERAALDERLSAVEDEDLRAALVRLGRAVRGRANM